MSTRNVEFLRSRHAAFSAGKFDEAALLVAPRTKVTDHGRGVTMTTREEFSAWMKGFYATSSNMKLVDAEYIDGGDWVTARFRGVGTQDGPLMMFLPTGKQFTLDVCEVWHFDNNGEADEGHNYSDGFGLLMQLGHLPPPK